MSELTELLPETTAEMIRTFSNPVCKDTYDSLPKIYGKKNRKIHLAIPKSQNNTANFTSKHYHSANEEHSATPAVKKKYNKERSAKLSQPKKLFKCSKKYCSCQKHQQVKEKPILHITRKVVLPQIRNFSLEDLQSNHKVSMANSHYPRTHSSSGLQNIIDEHEGIRKKDIPLSTKSKKTLNYFYPPQQIKINQEERGGNILRRIKTSKLSEKRGKHQFKPQFNSKFEIEEEQSEQDKNTDQLKSHRKQREQNRKDVQNLSARFKTEANDSSSQKSSQSISLSAFIFKGVKRQNTNFHNLNQSQKSFQKSLSRKASQLSNGFFRIPESSQYKDYLRSHRSLNQDFKIMKLIKRATFKVIREQNKIYFGQVDEQQRKHGEGLNVSEKQIFQGKYHQNIKVEGCQRNIDGVYTGQFQNGLRSGYGTFKWNNGQFFQGNWENGMKNGEGVWTSPKGDSYTGQWLHNRQEGKGVFKHINSVYTGQFKNFLKHGEGQQKFTNGDSYFGEYKNGKPHGSGRYEWSQGGYYQGEFVSGMREGRGQWVDSNGTVYQAQACLRQILSMDMENKDTGRANTTKESSRKVVETKGVFSRRMEGSLKFVRKTEFTDFLSVLHNSLLYIVNNIYKIMKVKEDL